MAIKPILFNAEMVRAILDGRKTCTRRVVKGFIPDDALWGYTAFTPKGYISCRGSYTDGYGEKFCKLPYQPGDILYVRETWDCYPEYEDENAPAIYYYKADGDLRPEGYREIGWLSPIHMPKEAVRIWLKVTDVRVERLQEITEDGAIREGAEGERCHHEWAGPFGCTDCMNTGWIEPPVVEFAQIWESTIKKTDKRIYGWDANPGVWVIEFERCEKPQEV